MAGILSVFFGVPQSKYAGMAILVSLAAVALSVLFGKERVPFSQKLVVVLLLVLLSLPAILVTLFQLTCLVTGAGFRNQRWWCSGYAWLISAVVILYSVLLVVMTVISFSADKQMQEIEKFYMTREGFQEMAEEYFEEEKEGEMEEPSMVTPELPEPEVAFEEEVVPNDVAASVETFTSCGAPYQ
jgi:uncharacterized membrane protein